MRSEHLGCLLLPENKSCHQPDETTTENGETRLTMQRRNRKPRPKSEISQSLREAHTTKVYRDNGPPRVLWGMKVLDERARQLWRESKSLEDSVSGAESEK